MKLRMKAFGADQRTQIVMTQHIIVMMTQWACVSKWKLHESHSCQGPDADTGTDQCTQIAMTQHILGIMLQSDYVIRLELHESFKCMGQYMTPHERIIDSHQENRCTARQLQPHRETVGI